MLAVDVRVLDRHQDVRVVASPIEQLGVELDVEVARRHTVGVNDEVLDLADLLSLAVDNGPAARIRLVPLNCVAGHAREARERLNRHSVVRSHELLLTVRRRKLQDGDHASIGVVPGRWD